MLNTINCKLTTKILFGARAITTSAAFFHPRNFRRTDETSSEFDAIAEIESNLFDAQPRSAPINNTAKLMKDYRRENLTKPIPLERPAKVPNVPRKPSSPQAAPATSEIDRDLNLSYVKLGLNDPLLSKLLLTAKSRKARDKHRQILIEGRRLILDALQAGLHLDTVLFSQKSHIAQIKDELQTLRHVQIVRVPQQDLRSWSTLTTCPGIIAIFRRPESLRHSDSAALPITVICDNIREPNNLGSIIRTCAAVPCTQVIVTKGCCDPWDTKSLRGGCGAQFHIKIQDDVTWQQIESAFLSRSNEPLSTSVYLAENNTRNSELFNVPITEYTEMQVGNTIDRYLLVIGGETHGISEDAYKFFTKCNSRLADGRGGSLHIPMSPNINSLNAASALTLLLFEMRKQLLGSRKESSVISSMTNSV